MKSGEAIVIKVQVPSQISIQFVDWQTKLNALVAGQPGFLSFEILSSEEKTTAAWTIIQRFSDSAAASKWHISPEYKELLNELKRTLGETAVQEIELEMADLGNGATEVFITLVSPDRDKDFREWIAKIHQSEAKFPGFRGMYVQLPKEEGGHHWLTFLHFDNSKNLDLWLASQERKNVLSESKSFISSLETHRIISPYAGWFASIEKNGQLPPVWKQTMIVLLVLFPIVMLELTYLSPIISGLNSSIATFIGNALSVSLIAWPFMPLAIKWLSWWLTANNKDSQKLTILGTVFICCLYVLEIFVFWHRF